MGFRFVPALLVAREAFGTFVGANTHKRHLCSRSLGLCVALGDGPEHSLALRTDDEGTETAPSEIQTIRKPGAIELTYFPYSTPWRSAFRITFPKVRADGRPTISPAARWFGLRFAGAQGNQELIWEIEPTQKQFARITHKESGRPRPSGAPRNARCSRLCSTNDSRRQWQRLSNTP